MTSRIRVLVVALVATLSAALLPGLTATAQLPSDGSAAADALAISQNYVTTADTVVVARDDISVDSLAGGPIIGGNAPLVLTPTDELSAAARAEIQRLGATSAIILGGPAAVSQAVEDALVAEGLTAVRYAGDSRLGTAEDAFRATIGDGTTAILARAFPAEGNPTSVFADSIGAGLVGAAFDWPILLTPTHGLSGSTRDVLETSALTRIVVVGGTAAISDAVVIQLESMGFEVIRLSADERAGTAASIAGYIGANGPGVQNVILVDGFSEFGWSSGFAAAVAGGDGDTAVLLSNGDDLPQATADYLSGGSFDVTCGPNTTGAACAAAGGMGMGGDFFTHVGTFDVTLNGSEVAEIVDATEDGNYLAYSDSPGNAVGFVDISDPANPMPAGTVEVGGETTAVAIHGDYVLVGVNTSEDFINTSGELAVIDISGLGDPAFAGAAPSVVATLDMGGQPDSVAVSPTGSYAAVAIENERDEDTPDEGNIEEFPQLPAGFVVSVDISDADPSSWTTTQIDMTGLAEIAPTDPEPEFVDINADDMAVVTLQENNHLAIVDLATGEVTNDFFAGTTTLTGVDLTEEEIGPQENGDIQLTETLEDRRREPDAVTWIDDDSFATADEGDLIGGSRGYTVFNADGTVEYEAGMSFEYAQIRAGHYNEGRSANKGGEPEGIEFGTFGGDPLLFVGAERTNVVGVYDVSDPSAPTYLQLLPAGIGPEGLKTIPGRNLFVASAEVNDEGPPSMITIYERNAAEPAYPQIRSTDTAGVPVPWVALSGMVGGEDDTAYAVSDSILGVAYIYDIADASTDPVIIGRTPITGSETSFDPEGIARAPEGGFWIASEGRYTTDDMDVTTEARPNAIVRVDADGVVQMEVELPAELVANATSSGFEGIAVTDDGMGATGHVYVVVQREWADDADNTVKIARYDVAADEWRFADYVKGEPESAAGGWVGLSEITLLPDGTFAIIERDNLLGTDATIKRVYNVDLSEVEWASYGDPRETVTKTLMADVLDDLAANSIWTPDKLESLAVLSNGDVVIATDNDGLDDAIGQTVYLNLGPWDELAS